MCDVLRQKCEFKGIGFPELAHLEHRLVVVERDGPASEDPVARHDRAREVEIGRVRERVLAPLVERVERTVDERRPDDVSTVVTGTPVVVSALSGRTVDDVPVLVGLAVGGVAIATAGLIVVDVDGPENPWLADEPERLARLWSNTELFKAGLHDLGYDTGASETPIRMATATISRPPNAS